MRPDPHYEHIFECDIEAEAGSLGPIETIAVQQMWKRVLRGFEPPFGGQIAVASSSLIDHLECGGR